MYYHECMMDEPENVEIEPSKKRSQRRNTTELKDSKKTSFNKIKQKKRLTIIERRY